MLGRMECTMKRPRPGHREMDCRTWMCQIKLKGMENWIVTVCNSSQVHNFMHWKTKVTSTGETHRSEEEVRDGLLPSQLLDDLGQHLSRGNCSVLEECGCSWEIYEIITLLEVEPNDKPSVSFLRERLGSVWSILWIVTWRGGGEYRRITCRPYDIVH